MQTDTVRPAAVTVYFAALQIISELSIHRDTMLDHARDVDRAANELRCIEKLRARIDRLDSSGADTSQELAMIESALESAESGVATFYDVALASVDWAEKSLLLLNAADSPELSRAAMDIALALREEKRPESLGNINTAVHAVWGVITLFADALKTATRESPPRHNEHPIDEHAIRAVVADQKWTIDRIRKVLPDKTLAPLFVRAALEWKTVKAVSATGSSFSGQQ